jgi:hypothetical protein
VEASVFDAVYTWVDGARPGFADQLAAAADAHQRETGQVLAERASGSNRFRDLGCLRYSLRSLWRYAPWISRVYLVTAGERPPWLDPEHPFIRLVSHEEIFPGPRKLPTFNSYAIEACLHRIDGLSGRFLYLNDDFFLTKAVSTEYFVDVDGSPRFIFDRWPMGAELRDPSPVAASGAFCRLLLDMRFGHFPLRAEVPHEPVLLDCAALEAIEREWPQAIARTRHNRFRTRREFGVVRMSRHYSLEQALRSGKTIEVRRSQASFARFGTPTDLAAQLRAAELADRPFLCVNDETGEQGPVHPDQLRRDTAILTEFFDRSFPQPAPWELPEPGTTERYAEAPSEPRRLPVTHVATSAATPAF